MNTNRINSLALPSVFIGGLGGSGTRVVADLLAKAGINMGFDLNESLDDLTFTLLLKRRNWFLQASQREKQEYLNLYITLRNRVPLKEEQLSLLKSAFVDMRASGHNKEGDGNAHWAVQRFNQCVTISQGRNAQRWGWKEPNSHLYAADLLQMYPNLKFVFVMRHGLDMAFSRNQQQLFNWFSCMDVADPNAVNAEQLPRLMLDYWLRVTERMVALREKFSPSRVHILSFESLFDADFAGQRQLSEFVDPTICEINERLVPPSTIGRFRDRDLSCFSGEQFDKLAALGYSLA